MDNELERLGKLLIAEGIVLQEEVEAAIESARLTGTPLGDALAKLSHIRGEELASFLGADYRFPTLATLEGFPTPTAEGILPRHISEQYAVVALCRAAEIAVLATAEAPTEAVVRNLQRLIGSKVKIVLSSRSQVEAAIARAYRVAGTAPAPAAKSASNEDTRVLRPPQALRATGAMEPVKLSREEFDRLAREYGDPVVRRWEKMFTGSEPLPAVRVK